MRSTGPLLKPSERNGKQPVAALARHRKVSRFEVLKHQIKSWWDDRFKVGEALLEIRDQKLYREDYETFDEFCEAEYGFKRAHAYRLIEFAGVKASVQMSPIGDKLVRESQARALAPVSAEKRVEVLTEAARAPGPVTAKRITEVATKNAKPEKQERLDKVGYPIPETILEDWSRADETAHKMIGSVSSLRSELKKAKDGNDPIFAEVTNSTIADLNNAYTSLKCVAPFAVCTSCQGRTPKKCSLCRGRGFVSEFAWRSYVPAESKATREAASKKK